MFCIFFFYVVFANCFRINYGFTGVRTADPKICHGKNGGLVKIPYNMKMTSETPGVKIYYTTDGSMPEVCNPNVKVSRTS